MKLRIFRRIAALACAVALAAGTIDLAEAQVLKGIGKALQDTGEAIGKGVDKTGEAIEKGVRETGDALKGESKQPGTAIIEPAYLFVQQAGSLRFKDDKLTLRNLAPSTFYFTDRPVRDAGFVSNEDFVGLWADGGQDGFKADPPSAAIAIAGLKLAEPLVVEILSAELKGSNATYTVNVKSGSLPAQAKDVALFVDAFDFKADNGYRFLDFLSRN
ncbi:hypothetical protein [Nitratireductor sp. XY-223]|uniref:hypothetical protein n=1 Tax=Nitratireductor sp. XY-223 TaxID=2561926 RepID=UPI0010A9FFC4|nr:hypothetical protein [Nitratireductor sp. XY-223]